jgi:ATP-dependent DNA ligase
MQLPVMPPVKPMLAKATQELPAGAEGDFMFEPKWDGFRCLVFRDRGELEMGSRNGKPLTRYFPELLDPLLDSLPDRCVLDGELVIAAQSGLDFEALQQRIHPAESRINRLAAETPASFVAFDVLAEGEEDLTGRPFADRRSRLEQLAASFAPPVFMTPMTIDRDLAAEWFDRFEGAGFDGIIAKAGSDPYRQDKRSQIKVKHKRTADCVVAGYRMHKAGDGVGSLLLGLYDEDATLHHVGVATSFKAAFRPELLEFLQPHHLDDISDHPWADWARQSETDADGRMPGAPHRWNSTKDQSWQPIRIGVVVEVAYEAMLSGRFRHSARFVRWRPDRDPESCTYAQLERVTPMELGAVFGQ